MSADIGAPVSVVIPCYRCGATVARAIRSVAAQTLRPREVIVIDDASDDDTVEILRDLQSFYGSDWLKIIRRQINGGPGAARNTGWESATQPYVAFLDADDAWHPRKIEIQLKYMQDHPEIAITGHRRHWLRENVNLPALPEQYKVIPISKWKMLSSNRFPTSTVMLRRDLGFRFDPHKRSSEDYLLWLRIICNGHKGAFIDLDLAYLYEAPYGEGGLSGQLWNMEKGELDTYWRLHKERLISWPTFVALSVFSIAKYVRRLVICKTRLRLLRSSARSRVE